MTGLGGRGPEAAFPELAVSRNVLKVEARRPSVDSEVEEDDAMEATFARCIGSDEGVGGRVEAREILIHGGRCSL